MNLNKIIFQSISLGYPGEPNETNLMHIQQWIIKTYGIIPVAHWAFKEKAFKAYTYKMDYDPVDYVNTIKDKLGITAQEATKHMNSYIKNHFVVKDDAGNDLFYDPELALYYAIQRSLEIIKKL